MTKTLPKVPGEMDADLMTKEELHAKLQKGYEDLQAGRTQNAGDAFAKFRENYKKIYNSIKWKLQWKILPAHSPL